MLVNELNLKALCVSAESVLPVKKTINVEGHEITFTITAFQSGYGSGRKTVISGTISLNDTNHTSTTLENADIEAIRRKVSKLLGLKNTSERKPRAVKEISLVKQVSDTLAIARRALAKNDWLTIDAKKLRTAFKIARDTDRENARKALQARAVNPILEKIEKLSPEERALLLASLQ